MIKFRCLALVRDDNALFVSAEALRQFSTLSLSD